MWVRVVDTYVGASSRRNGYRNLESCAHPGLFVYVATDTPYWVKKFDGQCTDGAEVRIYDGDGDNEGAEEDMVARCAKACLDKNSPKGGSWDGIDAKGFIVKPPGVAERGRCICEDSLSASCTQSGDGDDFDRYDFVRSELIEIKRFTSENTRGSFKVKPALWSGYVQIEVEDKTGVLDGSGKPFFIQHRSVESSSDAVKRQIFSTKNADASDRTFAGESSWMFEAQHGLSEKYESLEACQKLCSKTEHCDFITFTPAGSDAAQNSQSERLFATRCVLHGRCDRLEDAPSSLSRVYRRGFFEDLTSISHTEDVTAKFISLGFNVLAYSPSHDASAGDKTYTGYNAGDGVGGSSSASLSKVWASTTDGVCSASTDWVVLKLRSADTVDAVSLHMDATASGAKAIKVSTSAHGNEGWEKFWWWEPQERWVKDENDVLGYAHGHCKDEDTYCFQRLPSHLTEDKTELMAIQRNEDTGRITARYKWNFDSSNAVAHAAWQAFRHGIQTGTSGVSSDDAPWGVDAMKRSGGAPPSTDEQTPAPADQKRFAYRVESGVASLLLDADGCGCESTLSLGYSLRCDGETSASSGEGVDDLLDATTGAGACSAPRADNSVLELYWRDLRQPQTGFREWKDVLTVRSIPKPLDAGDGTGGGWTTMVLTDSKQAVNGIDSQYIRIGVHECHAGNAFRINEIRLLARHAKTASAAKGLSVDSSYKFDVRVNAMTWGGNQALDFDGGLYPTSAKIASEPTFRTENGWLVSSTDSKLRCQSNFAAPSEAKTLGDCKIECNSIEKCLEFTWDADTERCRVSTSLDGCQASSVGVGGSKDRLYCRNAFIHVKSCIDAPLSSSSNCWSAFDERDASTSWMVSKEESYPGRIQTRWMRAHFAGSGKPAIASRVILRQHSADDHISKLRLSCSTVDDIGRQVSRFVDVTPATDTTARQLLQLEEPLGPCTSVKVEVLEQGGTGSPGLSELIFLPARVPNSITIEGWVKSALRGRPSSAGRTWQKFWWKKENAEWPESAKDVLGYAYGQAPHDEQCQSASKFCFQRLPAHLELDCTEILVEQKNKDGTGTNRFKWRFSSTNEVSRAAWKAFQHGIPTVENEIRDSDHVWDPVPLQGASSFHAGQNSFLYRDMCVTAGCDPANDRTVRSLILSSESQPDKMNCKSTLLLGVSTDASQGKLGVGVIGRDASATSCRYPKASNGMNIYYRDICALGGGVRANGGVKEAPQISRANVKNFPSNALTVEAWAKCETGNPESIEAMIRYKSTGEYDTSSPRLFGWWDASGTMSASNGDDDDVLLSAVNLDFGNMRAWRDMSRNERDIVPVLNSQILKGPFMHAHPGPSRRPVLRMRRRSVITSKAEFVPRTYSAWIVARIFDQDPNADTCKIMSATSDEGTGVVNLEVRKDRTVHGMVFHNRVKTATAKFDTTPLSTENYVLIGMLNAGDHSNSNGGTDDIIEIRVNGGRGERNTFDIDNSGGFDAVARQLEIGSVDCSMDLAEVVVFDTFLGLKEIQTLERYLLRKWKIMGSEGGKTVIKAWDNTENMRNVRIGFVQNFVRAPQVMGLRIATHSLGANGGDRFDFSVLATDATGFDLRVTRRDSRSGWQKKSSQAMKCNDNVPGQFVQVTMPGASVEDCKQACTDLDTGCWEVSTKKEAGMDRVCRYAKSGEGCHPIGDDQWEHYRRGWAEDFEVSWWAQEKASINPSSALLSYSSLAKNEEVLMACDGTLVIGGTGISTGVELYDNTWHHVAMTWESSTGHVHVYRDGKPVFSRGRGKLLRVVTEVSQAQGKEKLAELYASEVYSAAASRGTASTLVHGVFEAPSNVLAESRSYYQRMDAVFVPTQSGEHTFTIAAAHQAELLISKDASIESLLVVANTTSCGADVISTSPRKWDTCACQTSAPIKMTAGQRYYIRAVHTHLGGATSVADHLAVGVASFPDGTSSKPIDATKYLELPGEASVARGHLLSRGGTVAVGQAQASPGVSAVAAQGGGFVVDEVRIWGSVRTAFDIGREAQGLVHSDDPRRHGTLWAYWRFNDDQRTVTKQLRQFVLKNKFSVDEGNGGLSLNPVVQRDACLTMVEDSNAYVIRVLECSYGGMEKERQVWQVRETGQITMVENAQDFCLTVVSTSHLAVRKCVPQQDNGASEWDGVDRQRWSVVEASDGGEKQQVQICIEAANGESWCIDPQSYTELNSNAGRLLKQDSVRATGWLEVPQHSKRRSINTPTWVIDSSPSGRDLKFTPFTLTNGETSFGRCRIRKNTRVAGFGSFGDEVRIAGHGDACSGGTKLSGVGQTFYDRLLSLLCRWWELGWFLLLC